MQYLLDACGADSRAYASKYASLLSHMQPFLDIHRRQTGYLSSISGLLNAREARARAGKQQRGRCAHAAARGALAYGINT